MMPMLDRPHREDGGDVFSEADMDALRRCLGAGPPRCGAALGDGCHRTPRRFHFGGYGMSRRIDHSPLMLAALMMGPHSSMSDFSSAASSAGLEGVTDVAMSANRCFNCGNASAAMMSL